MYKPHQHWYKICTIPSCKEKQKTNMWHVFIQTRTTSKMGIKVVNQFRLGKVYKLYKYILVFKNVLVNACPKFNQTIVNLVVGQITNLGDVHKFCIFLRFEGRNDEKCTEVTINMHFQNTKIKTWKKKARRLILHHCHKMVCTLAQIYPKCAIHWLEKDGKKMLSATPFNVLWSFWTLFGAKWFLYPKKTVILSLSF